MEGLRGHTSGLAVPTYVIDLPQGGGKVSLQPNYVVAQTGDGLLLRNYQDRLYQYRNPRSVAPAKNNRRNGKPASIPMAALLSEADPQARDGVAREETRAAVRIKSNRRLVKPGVPVASLFTEADYQPQTEVTRDEDRVVV